MNTGFILGLIMVAISLFGGPDWGPERLAAAQAPADRAAAFNNKGDGPRSWFRAEAQQARDLYKAGRYKEALPRAQRILDICEKRLGPDHPRTARCLHGVANIYMGLNRFRQAIPLYQRALAIREKSLGPENPATIDTMTELGKAYIAIGSYAQAQPLLERSLEVRKRILGPDDPGTAESLATLGELKRQMGALDQARALARQSLAIREKALGPDSLATAASLELLAMIYQQQGAAGQALPLAERALKIMEKKLGPEHPKTARSRRILGLVQAGRGDYAKAESAMKRGQKGRQGSGGMAEIYLAQGRYAQALKTLDAAHPNPLAPPQYLAQYHIQKGMALQGLGRLDKAAVSLTEAIRIIEAMRTRTPGERTGFFQGGRFIGHYKAYLAMIGVLAQLDRTKQPLPEAVKPYGADAAAAAFYFAESIKARSLLEAIAGKAGKGLDRELPADLAARKRQLQDQFAALEARRGDIYQPHPGARRDVAVFQAELEALEKKQQDLVEELRRRFPRFAALHYPRPYKTDELPLKPGEILLEYTLGEKESYLFRVEPGGRTQIFRLPCGQEQVARRVKTMLAPFRQCVVRREDLRQFSQAEAAAFYREILAPGLDGVSPATRVIIVPDGVLGAFPFEALVVQAGPDWGHSVLVADRWPVTYFQSAAILALNRHLGLSHAPLPLFALGDCIYDKNSPRYLDYKAGRGQAGKLAYSGSKKVRTMSVTGTGKGCLLFPPLPETRQTVMGLANLFHIKPQPPQVLLDVQATETRVRRTRLGQFRYLFFGTHGFLANNRGQVREPTLVLSQVENKPPDNGFLTFHEVLRLKLDADLVTLAACMTGVGQVTQGEGVLNFARAFQQAGARSVMVALWNIPVEESLKFYSNFYQALKAGQSKQKALKAARQAVRAKEPHPFFWAGLILHGEE